MPRWNRRTVRQAVQCGLQPAECFPATPRAGAFIVAAGAPGVIFECRLYCGSLMVRALECIEEGGDFGPER